MTLRTRTRHWFKTRRILHVKWPIFKHVENSLRGIRYAARHGFDGIDLDLLITKADPHCRHCKPGTCWGHVVGCHWRRPGVRDDMHDPERAIARAALVSTMTLDEAMRLRSVDGYRIFPVERLLRACARRGIVAGLEAKNDRRFEEPRPWLHIFAVAEDLGTVVSVWSIKDLPTRDAGTRRVKAAQRAAARMGLHVEAWTIQPK